MNGRDVDFIEFGHGISHAYQRGSMPVHIRKVFTLSGPPQVAGDVVCANTIVVRNEVPGGWLWA